MQDELSITITTEYFTLKYIKERPITSKNIKVTVNGTFEVVDVQIDPIAVDPRDVKMLQDLIVAASHDAMEKIKDGMKDKLGGLNIPGLNL
mgnify:CR=1 FL=1